LKILFLGDIVGRAGRNAIVTHLPRLRQYWDLDFVVANGENATQSRGITPAHADLLLRHGIDCMTLGDHAFDQRQLIGAIDSRPNIVRPLNLARRCAGRGFAVISNERGQKLLVIVALGQVFMRQPFDSAVNQLDELLSRYPLARSVDATVLDFHCEATSEKMMAGIWCDGRATLVAGTHTHIPTRDARILGKGTAFVTDAGMCGDYDSVIGLDPGEPMRRFVTGMTSSRFTAAKKEASLSGVIVETQKGTGLAATIEQIMVGGAFGAKYPY